MTERIRFLPGPRIDSQRIPEFLNPFDYMSSDDARVTLELWHRNVPFTYRYFDGNAPTLKSLIPDYAPEFTLSDYKLVIVVNGGFFGSLPGVLDRTALAKVALEHDGWKLIILFEDDVRHRLAETLDREAPELVHPLILGGEKPSPFGLPHWMFTRRQFLRGLALLRTHFTPKKVIKDVVRKRRPTDGSNTDGNRHRPLRSRYRHIVE